MIDAEIARFLKDGDRGRAEAAEYRALEYGRPGRPETWRNEESGDHGEVVAGPGRTVNALDCRDYAHTAWIDGGRRVARGTACRQSDGSWRVTG